MPRLPRNLAQRWPGMIEGLNLNQDMFRLNENSVICTFCEHPLTAVSRTEIERHLASDRCRNAVAVRQNPRFLLINFLQRVSQELHLPDDTYQVGVQGIVCTYCEIELTILSSRNLREHNESQKHQRALELSRRVPRPTRGATSLCTPRQNAFWMELCDAFTVANIPLDKLRNPVLKNFLEKWTRHTIPDSTTLRGPYINAIYEAKIHAIREEISDHSISLTVDEATDSRGRKIVNAVVTPLLSDRAGVPRPIHCAEVDQCVTAEEIVSFVNDSCRILWPDGIQYDRLLILNTDAARYMERAARLLRAQAYNKLVNVTCVVHGFHNVAEEVRSYYHEENDVIAETKRISLKAPNRVRKFHELLPGVALPPEPVPTRWGTWIDAASYYATNHRRISRVIAALEPDSGAVKRAQRLFRNPRLEENFYSIDTNFSCISTGITQLEKRNCPLDESVEIVERIYDSIFQAPGVPQDVKERMIGVFERNTGYASMKCVNRYLQAGQREGVPDNWTDDDLDAARYASIVSCEVERTFRRYKKLLADDRESFLPENLSRHIIIQCFMECI